MKVVAVFALFVVAVMARPQGLDSPQTAQITRYESDNIGIDGYRFAYATSDGVNREEEAVLKNVGTENEAMEVRGSYSYIGPDGVTYTIRFLANEDGFQPEGDHIPKAL